MTEVRAYVADDYDQLITLYQNKQAYGGNFDADRDEASRLLATSEQGNLYVVYDSDKLVGTFMILDNPHSFWLLRFAVDPTLTDNPHIAEALFDKASSVARERKHRSIIVYTDSEDEALNQRYADLGCHKAGNYRCYWKEIN